MGGVIKGVTNAVTGTVKTILGDTPTPPAAPAPVVMPTTDDAAVQAAQRRQAAAIQARSGRQSTILTGTAEKLGG